MLFTPPQMCAFSISGMPGLLLVLSLVLLLSLTSMPQMPVSHGEHDSMHLPSAATVGERIPRIGSARGHSNTNPRPISSISSISTWLGKILLSATSATADAANR